MISIDEICKLPSPSDSCCLPLAGDYHSHGASPVAQGSRICLQCRRPGFDPWVGKIPWRRKWQSTPVFLPGDPMDRGAWQIHGIHVVAKSVGHDLATKQQQTTALRKVLAGSAVPRVRGLETPIISRAINPSMADCTMESCSQSCLCVFSKRA